MFKHTGSEPAKAKSYFADIADWHRKNPARAATITIISILVVVAGFYMLGATIGNTINNISLLIKCFSKG